MANEVITLSDLPSELIATILDKESLSIEDVVNFSSTCKQFYSLGELNILSKTKCFERWPTLKETCFLYDSDETKPKSWFDVAKKGVAMAKHLESKFKELTMEKLLTDAMAPFKGCEDFAKTSIVAACIQVDNLRRIVNNDEYSIGSTIAKVMLAKAAHQLVSRKWSHLLKTSSNDPQLLELAAILAAEWCAPKKPMLHSYIVSKLNNMTEIVDEMMSSMGMRKLDNLCKVWKNLNFSLGHSYFKALELHEVLDTRKSGNVLLLLIIFKSIAYRLGIKCDLMSCNHQHFFLRCKNESDGQVFIVIDDRARLKKENATLVNRQAVCPIDQTEPFEPLTAEEFMMAMARDLGRAANYNMMARHARGIRMPKVYGKRETIDDLMFLLKPKRIEEMSQDSLKTHEYLVNAGVPQETLLNLSDEKVNILKEMLEEGTPFSFVADMLKNINMF